MELATGHISRSDTMGKKKEQVEEKEIIETQEAKLMKPSEWAKCHGDDIYCGALVESVSKDLITEDEYVRILDETKNRKFKG